MHDIEARPLPRPITTEHSEHRSFINSGSKTTTTSGFSRSLVPSPRPLSQGGAKLKKTEPPPERPPVSAAPSPAPAQAKVRHEIRRLGMALLR
jgi:hypothetical protein